MNKMTDRNKKRPDSDLNCLQMFLTEWFETNMTATTPFAGWFNNIIYTLGNDLTCSIGIFLGSLLGITDHK